MGEVDAMLAEVIAASKAVATNVDAESIRRFIESQPDVSGKVVLADVRGSDSNVGSSSGIVMFTALYEDVQDGPVEREFVLRYDPNSEDRLFFKYDLLTQFRVQSALQGSGVRVAKPYWLDSSGDALGTPGFIMERIRGTCPNQSAFTSGLLAEATPEARASMLEDLQKTMAKLHALDWVALGLSDVMMDAEGDTPVARIINMRWKTWEWIEPEEYDRLIPVRKWLIENEPKTDVVLTHGDSSLGNYMFRDNKVAAILDWELTSLGAAELDVAIQIMANDLNRHLNDGDISIMPSQAEWIAGYERHSGKPLINIEYFKKLGMYLSNVSATSQRRRVPEAVRKSHQRMSDYFWSNIEN